MSSRIPSRIRWTGHKKKEELLDDPLAESLYGLFLKVKDSPRHIAIKPEKLINEVYYICNRFYQDANPSAMIDEYAHEIETDLGWSYARSLVMSMAYVVLRSQKNLPKSIEQLVTSIEKQYKDCYYWNECKLLLKSMESTESPMFYTGNDLSSLLKNKNDLKKLFKGSNIFIIDKVDQLNAILGNNAEIKE